MVSFQEVEEYYKKNYHNGKIGSSISINQCLWIDYQKFCLDLSRGLPKKITLSKRVRLLMVKDMLEHKK